MGGSLLARRGEFATYDQVSPPDRMHYAVRRRQDADADAAEDIYGILYSGLVGLSGFRDRNDLPFIRETALWGIRYRFKQLDDAALDAFLEMPDRENLPIIEAVWEEYSTAPWRGNELQPFPVIRALEAHRFPEAIPFMARFVNAGFGQDLAQQFLRDMTGANFGGNTQGWLDWYASHKP